MVPTGIAYALKIEKGWESTALTYLSTNLVDLDHLVANPVYDPNRCSINYHPLHSGNAIFGYSILALLPQARDVGTGLLIHMGLDYIDCELMKKKRLSQKSPINKYTFSNTQRNEKELENLKKKYTLGEIHFDSVIIADFGENLKSVINSFSFYDVTAQDAKFITLNQWFDETIFNESSANQIYFPSVDLINYSKFRETYLKNYNKYPSQISILSYDILGLIYYIKKVQGDNLVKNILNKKISYIGEVGKFSFEDKIVTHKLDIYQVFDNKFLKINK